MQMVELKVYIVFVICDFGNLLPTLYSSGALLEDKYSDYSDIFLEK